MGTGWATGQVLAAGGEAGGLNYVAHLCSVNLDPFNPSVPEKNWDEPQTLGQPPLAHFVKRDRPTFLGFLPALPLSQTRSQETHVRETPSSLSPGPSPALAWPGPAWTARPGPSSAYLDLHQAWGPVTPSNIPLPATPFLFSCDSPPGGGLHCTTHNNDSRPDLSTLAQTPV